MKYVNYLLGLVLSISAFSTAVIAAGFWEVAGNWQLIERICSDGSQPTDEFQLGRDEITMTITKHALEHYGWVDAKVRVNNRYFTNGGYTLFNGMITFRNLKGKLEAFPYRLTVNNQMVIETSSFGEGGSCKPEQVLSSRFRRI